VSFVVVPPSWCRCAGGGGCGCVVCWSCIVSVVLVPYVLFGAAPPSPVVICGMCGAPPRMIVRAFGCPRALSPPPMAAVRAADSLAPFFHLFDRDAVHQKTCCDSSLRPWQFGGLFALA
jgi:hypothetical protein